jgi:hypothetical protein
MKNKTLACVTAALMLTAGTGFMSMTRANEAPASDAAAAQSQDAHTEAAMELVGLINTREVFTSAFKVGMNAQLEQVKKAGLAQDQFKKVEAILLNFADTVFDDPDLARGLMEIYRSEFSEAELRDMIAFYKTSAGQKLLSKQNSLFNRGAEVGGAVANKHKPTLYKKIQEALQPAPDAAPAPSAEPAPADAP